MGQTFTDWVCELHNDDPADEAPRQLVKELADPRITLFEHSNNLGPVATFNLAYAGTCPEPYFSILEDDNWWEPTFLAEAHQALSLHAESELAWSNLRFWREASDGSWSDTGRLLWPVSNEPAVPIQTPQLIQFDGPLHSNGAMLSRTSAAADGRLQTAANLPFSMMENTRERYYRSPVLFIPRPLVNFALTQGTARAGILTEWVAEQTILGGAFLLHIPLTSKQARCLWLSRRTSQPRATSLLFFAAVSSRRFGLLAYATPGDWLTFLAGLVRHPRIAASALRARGSRTELSRIIDEATAHLAASSSPIEGVLPALSLAKPADLRTEAATRAAVQ